VGGFGWGYGVVVLSGKELSYVLCVCGCMRGRTIGSDFASGGCCGGSTVV